MASVMKFTEKAVKNELRHNSRDIINSSYKDSIDQERSYQNIRLHPERGIEDYAYYQQRKSEVYCYERKDVKTMCGWIITAPKDLDKAEYGRFFRASYWFLCDRYGGEKNCISAYVHYDEEQPHLHFCFIPVVKNKNKNKGIYEEKICAKEVLTRMELLNFHPDYHSFLRENGFTCRVVTGITRAQGGNRSVQDLKERSREANRRVSRWRERDNDNRSRTGRWGND